MVITLRRASIEGAEMIWKMQLEAFAPLFVLPAYWNHGIARQAIRLSEEIHGDKGWSLDTILQEPGNCHLYEKMGYRQTGDTRMINDKLTLVFYRKG